MPSRKALPHGIPLWIDPSREIYFITVCCRRRGHNQLATPEIGPRLLDTVQHRNNTGKWFAHLALLMPDHVHLLLTFPESVSSIQSTVARWKDWTAKSCGVAWQRDFFEHRLRKEESFREKSDYILANPVRAGLTNRAEDWPYVFIAR